MPDQVPLNSNPQSGRFAEWRELLRPSKLRALQPREVLLRASGFQRVEAGYREQCGSGKPLRIAVLASLSSQHFVSVLKLFLYAEGLLPEIHAGSFDGIASGGLADHDPVWQCKPEALIILPASEDISSWPRMFSNATDIERWVEERAALYLNVWRSIGQRHPETRIYHALFVPPIARPLGNLERRYPFSRTNALAQLNEYLVRQCPPNVTLVDLEALSALVGRAQWTDEVAYFTSKQPFSLREMPLVSAYFARLIACAQGLMRKCLVLDLDNTLWGGVIGDDGLSGIRLDPADPLGEAYLAFQRYVLALRERGVLLAVCSKNDPAIARSAFEQHGDMLVKLDDLAAFVVNWDDKITNLRRIAQQLNIGTDALVFFDDNPAERAIVEQYEPGVLVIDVPEDPAQFVRALDLSFAFEWPQLTAEDLSRTESYRDDIDRKALLNEFEDYDAYLRSLQMKAEISRTNDASLGRVCQLIDKTNQFNLRTRRYSEEAISRMLRSPDHEVLDVRLRDRFTNYGIMAAVVLRYAGEVAFIENWVMSCRVFERGLEHATFNSILDAARGRGIQRLAGEYIPTPKNGYVAGLLASLGLQPPQNRAAWLPGEPEGDLYMGSLPELQPKPHFIEIASCRD